MKKKFLKTRISSSRVQVKSQNISKIEKNIKKGRSPSLQQSQNKKSLTKHFSKEKPITNINKPKTRQNITQKRKENIESTITKEDKEKIEKELLSSSQKTNKDFIKVFVRFRPLNDLENGLLSDNCGWTLPKYINDSTIGIYSTKEIKDKNAPIPGNLSFKYDKVFKSDAAQSEIYEYVGKRIVGDVMKGYNGTIFLMDNLVQVKPIICMVLIFLMIFIRGLFQE